MLELPSEIRNLVFHFSKLPGIGEKSALRLVFSLLRWEPSSLEAFSHSLNDLPHIRYCKDCAMFSEGELCSICMSEERQRSETICVVENANDLMAIEKSNEYRGLYQILGGVLNPLAGIGPNDLNFALLKKRVESGKFKTIILALNPSVEGDATCSFIKNELSDFVSVERIGFGVPIGGSLEYLDPMTIMKALENKKTF